MHQLWVIAGPNGSGKTTLCRRYLAGKIPVINPDEIAFSLSSTLGDASDVAIRAGRDALELQHRFLEDRQSFALETTLSGHTGINLMREARDAGFKVNLVFVCLESPMASVGRIVSRMQDGGHHVPRSDVERRYNRSLDNLPEGISLAHRAWLLDNSRTRLRLVASLERGHVKNMAVSLPKWLNNTHIPALDQAQGLAR